MTVRMRPAKADIERVARELCEATGESPDRLVHDYGRTSWMYPAWEGYREHAAEVLHRQS